jgi:hypothetical protein
MAFVWAKTGKEEILKMLTNGVSPSTLKLHLYKTTQTPSFSSVASTFNSAESTETGYAARDMDYADFTISNPSAEISKAQNILEPFTFSVAATVWGYYVTNQAGTILIGAEQFSDAGATGYVLGSSGGVINITLSMSLS